MKKKFAKIFNRSLLVLLAILLQVGILIAAFIFVSRSSYSIVLLIYTLLIALLIIIQIYALFHVIYKQTDAEFKIPWLFILLCFPVLGGLIYIIFSPRRLKKSDQTLLRASDGLTAKYFKPLKEEDKKYGSSIKTFNYLDASSGLYPTKGNRVTFYKSGEEFFPALINSLKEAEKFIFMEFFIISRGKEWDDVHKILKQKASEGVKVKIIFDDVGCIGCLPGQIIRILRKEGIQAYKFNKLKPIITASFNNRDHRKIVVIDHKYGFTGGINLGDEYANIEHPFGYWKDTMIRIEGPGIAGLLKLFLQNFDLASRKTSNYKKYFEFEFPTFEDQGYVLSFGHGPAPYYKERVGEHTLINIIESAKEEVFISSPYFIPSEELLCSIRRVALSGVKVKLFLPGIPDKKIVYHIAETYFAHLIDAGVEIHLYRPGFNHEKCILADNKLAFIGTINMDFRSLVHHFECGSILYKCPCLEDIHNDFLEMEYASEIVPGTFTMPRTRVFICSVIRIFNALL